MAKKKEVWELDDRAVKKVAVQVLNLRNLAEDLRNQACDADRTADNITEAFANVGIDLETK